MLIDKDELIKQLEPLLEFNNLSLHNDNTYNFWRGYRKCLQDVIDLLKNTTPTK